jgi:5'-nucleotidase / UDP-sugar diphosphatase
MNICKSLKYRGLLFSLLILPVVFYAEPASAGKGKRVQEVVILHVNDMHSKIDNMGKLAWLADSLKTTHPHVFIVSAGDNFTGNPIVDMYPDTGFPMIDLMNRVGFNLSAIGNHEFDMGQELQNKRRAEANFPFICANMDVGKSILHKPVPYALLKAGRLKIPFLGFIQLGDKGWPDSHPSKLGGLSFVPALDKAQEFMWLKNKYGMLIGLTHLGVEGDEPLAQQYPQFDLIIGGHSHTTMKQAMMINNVMIVQAGSGLQNVGKTTLQFTGRKITGRSYELIPMSAVKGTKPEIQQLIDKYNNNDEMKRIVGFASTPFSTKYELGCLMTDAITAQFGLDFAFQNSGGIRISSFAGGDITLTDIFRLDPFGNQVVTISMTPDEIKSLIKYSFNKDKEVDLMVSGMIYTVFVGGNKECSNVEMTDYSGKPFDPGKKYKVGMNSYIAASYLFEHSDPGSTTSETSAQTLIDYLLKIKTVSGEKNQRIFVK